MKIGIIGAGYVGRALAKAASKAGHEVMVSNSRGPQTLFSDSFMLGCTVGTIEDAAKFGEVVIVAITTKHYKSVPVAPLAGKIVIDANNYYPDRDDAIPELDAKTTTSSELLAAHLPTSKIVKAFNAIPMTHFERDPEPTGSFDRRAMPIAGDDEEAKRVVAKLHDEFGYDTVDVGPLAEGWRFHPNTPVYCVRFNREWLQKVLADTTKDSYAPPPMPAPAAQSS